MSWMEGECIWTDEDEMRYQIEMDRVQEEAAEQAHYEEEYQEYLKKAQKK